MKSLKIFAIFALLLPFTALSAPNPQPFHPKNGVTFFEDFHGNGSGSQTWGGVGCNGNLAYQPIYSATHPGTIELNTATASNGYGACAFGSNPGTNFGFGSTKFEFEAALYVPTLSTVSEEFHVECGLFDDPTVSSWTDGCLFKYNRLSAGADKWAIECKSNGTATTKVLDGTGGCANIAVTAADWDKLRMVVNASGTQADFWVDGVSAGCPITTNIPTGSSRVFSLVCGIRKSAGTTLRSVYLDYLYLNNPFTR